MANYKHIIPFIKLAEGGLVNDPADNGGETNKGITYKVWCSYFGYDVHKKFIEMSDENWGLIFKKLFWDKILGDQINSQRIADVIADWVWGSGCYYPELDIQIILNHLFNQHLSEDGNFGQQSIASLNNADEETLYNDIIARRFQYLDDITTANVNAYEKLHPNFTPEDLKKYTDERFINGWKNRMNNLIAYEKAQA